MGRGAALSLSLERLFDSETRLALSSRQSTLVKLREAASSVPHARCTPLHAALHQHAWRHPACRR